MLTLSGAPSTTSHLDINNLSIVHYLGSPLGYCTLIFDLMRNLYLYNACIYIYSISPPGAGACSHGHAGYRHHLARGHRSLPEPPALRLLESENVL